MIGALQKILNKTAEEETKAEVEEYVASVIILIYGLCANLDKTDRLLFFFSIFRLIKGLKVRKSVSPECIKPTKTS